MSSKDQYLAIDCGTQSLRALLFDNMGRLLNKTRVPFKPYLSPQPGWAEQDPEVYWRALSKACQDLWKQHGVRKEAIVSVALTTQRGSVVNIDKNGHPLRPAILWLDQRISEGEQPIGGIWGLLFGLAGVRDTVAYLQANAECNWLRSHQPQIWKETHKFLLLSGYLNYKLTGCFTDSVANQVGFFPFDYKKLTWASPRDWKWSALGIEPDMLSELVTPGTELGRICPQAAEATGLPVNLPVIAAAADKACEVLGSGCLSPQVGSLSYGTTATYNITSQKYLEPIAFIPPYPAAIPNAYNPEVQVFRGYWMVEWFKQQFGQKEVAEAETHSDTPERILEESIRHISAGSDGLLVQPYWSPGIRFPGPEARGSVLGFCDVHTRAHFFRAILEGIAFAMREGKERLERRTKVPVNTLRVSGGGSQSDTAMQMTADIFGLPAARPHTFETSGLGAAMIAAVSCGAHSSYTAAAEAMCRTERVFEPRPTVRRTYDELYKNVYSKIYPRVRPLYQALREAMK